MTANKITETQLDGIKLMQDSYLKLWAIYVTWFNWFFGSNLLAFSWFITSGNDKLALQYMPFFMFFIIALVILGIFVVRGMGSYSKLVREKALELTKEKPDTIETVNLIFGGPVTELATWTSFLCHVVAGIAWGSLGLYLLYMRFIH
jgi:hypothetical protein